MQALYLHAEDVALLLHVTHKLCTRCCYRLAQQVYAVAAANVTLGFQFDGIDGDTLSPAAAAALKHTASEMAGGYSEQLITVSTAPPALSQNGNQVELQATVEDAPAATSVVKRGKDLGQPTEAPPAVTAGRRLHGAGSALPATLAGFLADGNTQPPAVTMPSTPGLPRRLMQDAAYLLLQDIPSPAKSPAVNKGNSVPVWLMYKHVAPANTTTLLLEFCTSCNVTPTVAAGFDLAPQPCGVEVKAALEEAGVQLVDDSYAQLLTIPPTVSSSSAAGCIRMLCDRTSTSAEVAHMFTLTAATALLLFLSSSRL